MTPMTHPLLGDTLYTFTHASGLPVTVWPLPKSGSVYALFATRYGSVHNTLPTPDGGSETVPAGIAHYLEHKLFESEEGDAFKRFAETGASANAYTSFGRTAYLFHATENILPSLDILLDFVQHPYFTAETVQKEQGIIGQEIRMGEDNPGRRVLFNLLRGMYHTHPVRIDIAGTVESISHITPELLYRCYAQYYNLHNMLLVVAGHITPEQVKDACDRLLKPATPYTAAPLAVDEPETVAQMLVEDTMPVAAPLFYLGFKEPVTGTPTPTDLACDRILPDLIAGKTSPLYTVLMERGLINAAFGTEYFGGPGYGVWLFGGESAHPEETAQAIEAEIRRLQQEGIDPDAFEAARRGAYGMLVRYLDNPEECAELLLDNQLNGVPLLSELDALANLTAEELQQQLCRRIRPDNRTLSVIHPL
ncbi:MAG: insulinase family protein [Clostridia bacterium]|nr:insulinase family protein [Clostridia bacterium]